MFCESEFANQNSDCGMLEAENILANNIKVAESKLSSENPYAFYDIDLSNEEVNALFDILLLKDNNCIEGALLPSNLQNISIKEDLQKIYSIVVNKADNHIKLPLLESLAKISSSNMDVIASLVERIVFSASSYNGEGYMTLFSLRLAGDGNSDYWHVDGNDKCDNRNIISLKGPSTLFYSGDSNFIKDRITDCKLVEDIKDYRDYLKKFSSKCLEEELVPYSKFIRGEMDSSGEEFRSYSKILQKLMGRSEEELVAYSKFIRGEIDYSGEEFRSYSKIIKEFTDCSEESLVAYLRHIKGEMNCSIEELIDYSKNVDRASFGKGTVFLQGDKAALHRAPIEKCNTRVVLVIDKCKIEMVPEIVQEIIQYEY